MEQKFLKEDKYLLAKKQVEKIKGFYNHLTSYILVNIFISCVIIFGLMHRDNSNFTEVISNFGVYATWIFWGIGLLSHWNCIFGKKLFFSKKWEEKKLKEYMDNEKF